MHCARIVNGVVSIKDKSTRKNIIKTLLLCRGVCLCVWHTAVDVDSKIKMNAAHAPTKCWIFQTLGILSSISSYARHMFEFFPFSTHRIQSSCPLFSPVCCSIFSSVTLSSLIYCVDHHIAFGAHTKIWENEERKENRSCLRCTKFNLPSNLNSNRLFMNIQLVYAISLTTRWRHQRDYNCSVYTS